LCCMLRATEIERFVLYVPAGADGRTALKCLKFDPCGRAPWYLVYNIFILI